MDTKFTKGEWSAICCVVVADKGAKLIKPVGVHVSSEDEANAQLIASAPAMYDFIESLLDVESLSMDHDEITALLKKARGES